MKNSDIYKFNYGEDEEGPSPEFEKSLLKIYDLLNVKDPKKFHNLEAAKNIEKVVELLRIISGDIELSNSKARWNRELVDQISSLLTHRITNISWELIFIKDILDQLRKRHFPTKMHQSSFLRRIVKEINNPEPII